ncbi:MAG TPA: hypothetical protein VMB21_21525, partial [Candidatus Limnocylindria bacterium]|nr:hypothetical protein [Candidatus Limnocylindria bacterium]
RRGYGFGPQTDRTAAPNGQGYYVRLWWGYSFGHGYAVIIGPTNLTILPQRDVVPWVPGIYFTDPSRFIEPLWNSSTVK